MAKKYKGPKYPGTSDEMHAAIVAKCQAEDTLAEVELHLISLRSKRKKWKRLLAERLAKVSELAVKAGCPPGG